MLIAQVVTVRVWDKDLFGPDDLIGETILRLDDIPREASGRETSSSSKWSQPIHVLGGLTLRNSQLLCDANERKLIRKSGVRI